MSEHRSIRRRSATLLAGFIAVLSFSSARAEAPATITVDPAETRGVWEGWGTSLAWFGKVFGDRDDLADVLFTTKRVELAGEPLPGLDMNIVRYNAGACGWNEIDGRRMVVSKIILPFRQIEGFWLDGKNPDPDSDSWDWSVDANQRALLLKAKERGVDHFELFSNSLMWWMTKNDNPSGNADKRTDNLPPENYGAFATSSPPSPPAPGATGASPSPAWHPSTSRSPATGSPTANRRARSSMFPVRSPFSPSCAPSSTARA